MPGLKPRQVARTTEGKRAVKTIVPTDGLEIRESCRLAEGVHVVPRGIVIAAPEVTLDGAGATIIGCGHAGVGVAARGVGGVAVRRLTVRGFRHGIEIRDCAGTALDGCDVAGTSEAEANTIFLDIWRTAESPYGGAILLIRAEHALVTGNRLMHQQSGLLAYHCRRLRVVGNNASYCSGFGFNLYDTADSLFEDNCADYCCRFEPREGGLHFGHMGADAAGFVAVRGSSRNVFRRNAARLGGDGFFLAGLGPDGVACGCDDNLFEQNDGSLSPNIAFEATFCRGNVFRGNYADRCNYGFWLGFSWDTTIEGNRMVMNRQAGVAVENGHSFRASGNTFQANGHGVLLWSRRSPQFAAQYPDCLTSWDWQMERNVFTRNVKGIRIAADQDHGIRAASDGTDAGRSPRPRDHRIVDNDIQDNRVGIELYRTDGTVIERNILNRNVEANVRQEDAEGTVLRNDLGAAGAYL
jgi:parallel beta-helix repeat protein